MDMGFYKINVQGIVQGVGFRPFLYNLAEKFGLTGSIINKGNIGVELIVFSSDTEIIKKFTAAIESEKPPISYIEAISWKKLNKNDIKELNPNELASTLQIEPSKSGIGPSITSPPDIAICSDCIADMNNPKNERFFQYPFTACAVCGPRYTTIQELPYDRERTTMKHFPFCIPSKMTSSSCYQDYIDTKNRRFHAQTYSCNRCGPNYFFLYNAELNSESLYSEESSREIHKFLTDRSEIKRYAAESVQIAAQYIQSGKIVAIMGIGGVHIVGDARNSQIIDIIRSRKRRRKTKPFAIMVKNITSAEKYVILTEKAKTELTSYRRPIVLLPKRENILPENIAPGLHNVGVMLPYAGIHHLLFQLIGDIPLIFTSGNFSDLPMAISPLDVITQLNQLVDGFLLHNREISQRVDDSVLRVNRNYVKIIRRSRGYVPEYFPLPFQTNVKGAIAVGPELSSTGVVARGRRLFPTQHIGNVDNLETFEFLKNAILHMKTLLKLSNSDIEFISMDSHPQFQSTKLAKQLQEDMQAKHLFAIQHHFAHAASLMVDNNISLGTPVVVAALDGVGYGLDGNVWGGEIISGTYNSMKRTYHLSYIPMVGGDLCVTYPTRMTVGFLLKLLESHDILDYAKKLEIPNNLKGGLQELQIMQSSYELNENVAYSSSCGRLLDTISNLLGVCNQKYYRGEPAMRLEGIAFQGNPKSIDFSSRIIDLLQNSPTRDVIPSELMIQAIIDLLMNQSITTKDRQNIAASALYSIGKIFGYASFQEALKKNVHYIGLSGGVAYNDLLSDGFYDTISQLSHSTEFVINKLYHNQVPPGDAGISTGQAAIGFSKIS